MPQHGADPNERFWPAGLLKRLTLFANTMATEVSGRACRQSRPTKASAWPVQVRLLAWACRTRTCKRHFEKAIEMLGEFSLDTGTFWDQRLFACELPSVGLMPISA